ncbi:MAG: ribosome maturation factor RimP [Acidimicrobiia bacterium]|nr:ribosome maturation factor RimP [Acidimicrobiia bacterium]MYH06675.1 ribosome maturation factor RimP [Acidimicrobiia bacterium]MYK56752.1 ribosome maturation factor RimP [Acidimicrobiia bacterium]
MRDAGTLPKMTVADRLSAVVGPYLEAERLELDSVEMLGRGGARILRVVVDAEGGIGVDRLAETSRRLSRLLDAETDLEGPYRLEVSSPGLERRLRTPRHFEKAIGREVVMKVRAEGRGAGLRGQLVSADEDGCELSVEGEVHSLPYGAILSARTIFRWGASPKPGKGKARP